MQTGLMNKIIWNIVPDMGVHIIKNCPKCHKKTDFVSTGNFRINVNQNDLDVWLIYQCKICKSTYNLSIHERIKVKELEGSLYQKYLDNDKDLAAMYSLNKDILRKNKVEADWDRISYQVFSEAEEADNRNLQEGIRILIKNDYHLNVRLDKILAEQLEQSRSRIKKAMQRLEICGSQGEALSKTVAFDEMEILVSSVFFTCR